MKSLLRLSARVRSPKGAWPACVGILWFCGCAELQESPIGPRYHPANISRSASPSPKLLRRVAVLPLGAINSSTDMQAGVETLEPILLIELQKRRRFEVMPISQSELMQWTGRRILQANQILPKHSLERIQKETGCDGILFTTLTAYRPYLPAAIGWRMNLVAAADQSSVWAADEVFDAANPGVVNSARDYQRQQPELRAGLREGRKILLSPVAFGHYTLGALLDTLPAPVR